MPLPDERLREYATDRQWEILCAIAEEGSGRAAARKLGIHPTAVNRSRKAVLKKAALHGYSPDHDMVHTVPDGFVAKGVSTYYRDGEVKAQWVKSSIDRERQEEIFREALVAMAEEIPRAAPVVPPDQTSSELMACYPVGDHHLGMLAWAPETGADYDLKIAQRLLTGAMNHLVDVSPACDRAAVILLGDFMHYDSFETVTPASKNQLDADSRFPRVVRAAIRSTRFLIKRALEKHKHVLLIVEIGNHDLSSSIFLMEAMKALYEDEPRVTVDNSPKHFHYFTFGKCLIGTHHGHGVKLDKLPMLMAADRPDDWGQTEYRYWWTGHLHDDAVKEFPGCRVERFRVLPGQDAWAANKGFRSGRDMKAIILHKEFGEVARHLVNPEMLA